MAEIEETPEKETALDLNVPELDENELEEMGLLEPKKEGDDEEDEDLSSLLGDEPDKDKDDDDEDNPADKDEGDDDDNEDSTSYVPGTTLKSINSKYNLGIKEENLGKDFTVEKELQVLSEIMEKQSKTFKSSLSKIEKYNDLLKSDDETLQFLQARAAGKTMKDLVSELASKADFSDKESLYSKYLQEELNFSEEEAKEQIEVLKEKEKFDTQHDKVLKFYKKKEAEAEQLALQKEELENQQAQREWEAEVKEYNKFLETQDQFGEFKITPEIRKKLQSHATLLDEDGLTQLDTDLQSRENVFKAQLAILYWDQIEKVLKTTSSNKTKKTLLEMLSEEDASTLQSSSTGKKAKGKAIQAIANSF